MKFNLPNDRDTSIILNTCSLSFLRLTAELISRQKLLTLLELNIWSSYFRQINLCSSKCNVFSVMQIECFEKKKWKLNEAAGKVAVCISAMEVSVGLISFFFLASLTIINL